MLIGLAKIIHCPGKKIEFSHELDFSDLDFGNCRVSEPVKAVGKIENTAGVLQLDADVISGIHGICDRCTCEFDRSINIPVHAVLETDPDSQQPDDIWTFTVEGDAVDLEEIVRTALVFGVDSKMLCKPDCKGLCCRCGVDLNYEACRCKPEIDPRFAVLQKLLDKE